MSIEATALMLKNLDANELRDVLYYDPGTGVFTWRGDTRNFKSGDVAGCAQGCDYRRIRINGTLYKAHRLAWLYMFGRWPVGQLDHINRNKTDNRISNLREASNSQNQANTIARGKSQFKGVSFSSATQKWRAGIKKNGVFKHIGFFKCEVEAARAYDATAKIVHGRFARPNFKSKEI